MIALALLLLTSTVQAQWDEPTKLALAQCFVAEAGWDEPTEWAAIGHVLMRRQRDSGWNLLRMIRQYCAVHRTTRPSPRQRYIRNLPWGDLTKNPGFPSSMELGRFSRLWGNVRAFTERFSLGVVSNPAPGARHWGGVMDRAIPGAMVLPSRVRGLDGSTVELRNRFYSIPAGRAMPRN
jgi:hypothetical protein